MDQFLFWPGVIIDALGILASVVAVLVHAVLWREAAKQLRINGDTEYAVSATKFKRWVRVNTGMALLIGLNMTRWFVLNDYAKIVGKPSGAGAFEDATWAICDLLLVVMPLILICNMRAITRSEDNARG